MGIKLKRSAIVAAMLVGLVFASLAPIVSSNDVVNEASLTKKTTTIGPTDDTFVVQWYPGHGFEAADTSFGTYLYLQAGGITYGYEEYKAETLIKFDLSSNLPAGAVIENATLYLNGETLPDYGVIMGIRAIEDDDWDELTVTWNTKPEYGGVLDEPKEYPRYDTGKWYSWDFTDFVREEFYKDGVAGFCVFADWAEMLFTSKDEELGWRHWLYLEVTYSLSFTISNAHFEPKKFDPSAGETTTLYFKLSEPARRVNIQIYDNERNPVWDIKLKDVPAGLNGVVWAGLDEAGDPVAPGMYKAVIKVRSYDNEVARARARVRVKY